jgi:UDP-glucose:(heptosyl)LPS alpha-1,3-glucosyltransferase
LLQVGSGFKTKGLDRSLRALAHLPEVLARRARLIVIGQDKPTFFLRQAEVLGVGSQVTILQGRSDIPRFLRGADLLVHPAYSENTGTVLLEALVAGLPVIATAVCGYAHYIDEAKAGVVVPEPFQQAHLDSALADALSDAAKRAQWQTGALAFAEHADIYSNAERAADLILGASSE